MSTASLGKELYLQKRNQIIQEIRLHGSYETGLKQWKIKFLNLLSKKIIHILYQVFQKVHLRKCSFSWCSAFKIW